MGVFWSEHLSLISAHTAAWSSYKPPPSPSNVIQTRSRSGPHREAVVGASGNETLEARSVTATSHVYRFRNDTPNKGTVLRIIVECLTQRDSRLSVSRVVLPHFTWTSTNGPQISSNANTVSLWEDSEVLGDAREQCASSMMTRRSQTPGSVTQTVYRFVVLFFCLDLLLWF